MGVDKQLFGSDLEQLASSMSSVGVVYEWRGADCTSDCGGSGPDKGYPNLNCTAVGPLPLIMSVPTMSQ